MRTTAKMPTLFVYRLIGNCSEQVEALALWDFLRERREEVEKVVQGLYA